MPVSTLGATGIKRRKRILEILLHAGRGHIGSAFSILEILEVLYGSFLNVNPKEPDDPERDRFLLSKGHGCLALYVVLAEAGFFDESELNRFCNVDAILGGHPESATVPGVDFSTGSLGHGLPVAVGMALAGRMDGSSRRTYVLLGDGECNEGSVWEAAMAASQHRLSNLTVLIDYNKMQCYAPTKELLDLEPFADKWRSFGFEVYEADGHDTGSIKTAVTQALTTNNKPQAIICHTVKGKGIKEIENNPLWHHKSRVPEEAINDLIRSLESSN